MNLNAILLQEGGAGGGAFSQQLIMFGLIGIVFYFFMLRPQIKRSKEARLFKESLAVGDKVVTAGGIHGKVLEINESTILLAIEGSGKIRIEKNSVTSPGAKGELLADQQKK
jgi:preprotein translocase subunit YajC